MKNDTNTGWGKIGIAASFLTAACLLIAMIGVSYWTGLLAIGTGHTLANQQRVIGQLNRFHFALTDAETGQRGYLLTGEESYLEPYNLGITKVGVELDDLRKLVADGELAGDQVEQLADLAQQEAYGTRSDDQAPSGSGPRGSPGGCAVWSGEVDHGHDSRPSQRTPEPGSR